MATFTQTDIKAMHERNRVNFINSLSGFKSANLIGTISPDKQSNLCIISSAFHIGADPALLGFISRPHSVDRHTLENIITTGYFTLNHVNTDIIDQAHQTSARYEREQSEFAATGLNEHWVDDFNAPFVTESAIRVGLGYKEHHTLCNDTVMVLGEIIYVDIPDGAMKADGLIDLTLSNTVAVSGLDCYFTAQKIKRLSYAKPNTALTVIEE
jgi:flavin reductase (DIM6/NTAB) family NADH-FMN oxidoreductase RutF